MIHDIGDRLTVEAEFVDDGGAATDPTNVTLLVKRPSGAVERTEKARAGEPSRRTLRG